MLSGQFFTGVHPAVRSIDGVSSAEAGAAKPSCWPGTRPGKSSSVCEGLSKPKRHTRRPTRAET